MYRCGSQALLAASFQRPTRRRHWHVCQAAAVPMRRRFMFRKHCARTPRPIAHLPVAPAYALVPRCEWTAHSLSKLNLAHRPRCSSAALAPARQTAPAAPLPPADARCPLLLCPSIPPPARGAAWELPFAPNAITALPPRFMFVHQRIAKFHSSSSNAHRLSTCALAFVQLRSPRNAIRKVVLRRCEVPAHYNCRWNHLWRPRPEFGQKRVANAFPTLVPKA